jgi:hypothetical protein
VSHRKAIADPLLELAQALDPGAAASVLAPLRQALGRSLVDTTRAPAGCV